MIQIDRTVKWLLSAIVVLLAVIAFRPMIQLAPNATAATTTTANKLRIQAVAQTTSSVDTLEVGYQVPGPATITVPSGEYVRDVQVMDQSGCFVVRYDNRIEVYHVQLLNMARTTLEARLRAQGKTLSETESTVTE